MTHPETTTPANPAQGVSEADLLERLAEAEAIIADRNDELALIDWISDKIGLPHDEELTRENFTQYLTAAIGAGGQAVGPCHFDILAEAMAEVKATSDGLSDQPIADIVQGCLDEIAALPDHPAPSGQAVAVKPLVWSEHPAGGEQAVGAGLGLYRVHANGDDWYLVPDHMGKGGKAAAQSDFERRILSAIAHPAQPGWRSTHRHVKRGSEYTLLGIGKMQTSNWWGRNPNRNQATFGKFDQTVDMREVAIYRGKDGKLWVRPREEFEDGRFEALSAAPTATGGR